MLWVRDGSREEEIIAGEEGMGEWGARESGYGHWRKHLGKAGEKESEVRQVLYVYGVDRSRGAGRVQVRRGMGNLESDL